MMIYKFQIRQIPCTIFPGNRNPFFIKPTFAWVKIFEKNNSFPCLKSLYYKLANRKKLILPLEKYFKTLREILIGTVDTFFTHLHFFTKWAKFLQSGRNNGVEI